MWYPSSTPHTSCINLQAQCCDICLPNSISISASGNERLRKLKRRPVIRNNVRSTDDLVSTNGKQDTKSAGQHRSTGTRWDTYLLQTESNKLPRSQTQNLNPVATFSATDLLTHEFNTHLRTHTHFTRTFTAILIANITTVPFFARL